MGVALLSFMAGKDLSQYPLDGPLPDLESTELEKTRQNLVVDLARRENLTIRQLYKRLVAVRAHFTVVGTPTDIADAIEQWFTAGAADGFNITPALMPSGLIDFVDQWCRSCRSAGSTGRATRAARSAKISGSKSGFALRRKAGDGVAAPGGA